MSFFPPALDRFRASSVDLLRAAFQLFGMFWAYSADLLRGHFLLTATSFFPAALDYWAFSAILPQASFQMLWTASGHLLFICYELLSSCFGRFQDFFCQSAKSFFPVALDDFRASSTNLLRASSQLFWNVSGFLLPFCYELLF